MMRVGVLAVRTPHLLDLPAGRNSRSAEGEGRKEAKERK